MTAKSNHVIIKGPGVQCPVHGEVIDIVATASGDVCRRCETRKPRDLYASIATHALTYGHRDTVRAFREAYGRHPGLDAPYGRNKDHTRDHIDPREHKIDPIAAGRAT